MTTDLSSTAAITTPPPRLHRRYGMWIAVVVVAIVMFIAILAPLIAPALLGASDLASRLLPPGADHLLGTDDLGRDVLSQTLYALRTSLFIAVTATIISGLIGVTLGAIAGWKGGPVDGIISFFVDVQASIPAFVLALGAIVIFGGSPLALILVLSLEGWERFARVTRGEVMRVRTSGYVQSALNLGLQPAGVGMRHVLPAISGPIFVQFTLALPAKILIESALSFLGFGVQPPSTSLGQMIGVGRDYLSSAWWIAIFPTVFILIISVAISVIGDNLQDRMVDRED